MFGFCFARSLKTFLFLVISFLSTLSCRHWNETKHEDIHHAFRIIKDSNGTTTFAISRKDLEREFLMRGNIIQGGSSPEFHGLKTRVVVFNFIDGKLLLIEAEKGRQHYNSIPQKLILTTFPLLKQDEEYLHFDFNSGMKTLFTMNDYFTSDFPSMHPDTSPDSISSTLIQDAEYSADSSKLLITQASRWKQQVENQTFEIPIQVKYIIEYYSPDSSFKMVESTLQKNLGYFEVSPVVTESGASTVYATKWNLKNKIRYSISANTPTQYREAIKEGVLYWNRYLGDVLEVDMAPEGVTAPSYRYNMIQWIDSVTVSNGYADFQMDPRTGEILNAQIYLPETYGFWGERHGHFRKALTDTTKGRRFSLKGFQQEPLCSFNVAPYRSDAAAQTLVGRKEARDLGVDWVKTQAAHEVGHTLGLRHNFAGWLGASMHADAIYENFDRLLKGEPVTENKASSSVMDYLEFPAEMLLAHAIANPENKLDYDSQAIQGLYFNKSDSISPFCTDSNKDGFVDCAADSSGKSVFEMARASVPRKWNSLPYRFLFYKLQEQDEDSLNELFSNKSVKEYSDMVVNSLNLVAKALDKNSRLLSFEFGVKNYSQKTEEKQQQLKYDYLKHEVSRLGSWDRIIPISSLVSANELYASIETFLHANSGMFHSDLAPFKKGLHKFLSKVEKEVPVSVLKIFQIPGENLVSDHHDEDAISLWESLSQRLEKISRKVLLEEKSRRKVLVKLSSGEKQTELPEFVYNIEERLLVAKVLIKKNEKKALLDTLTKILSDAIGTDVSEVDISSQQRWVAAWMKDYQIIKHAIEENIQNTLF